ncbi:hypothetical protein N474_03745 [Pseudoalteromonas luteoviolacea CPMOR-2]|uniref:Phosphoglycerate mutase n=1 Tax=Pseudoalteromonas luteoviolacea DSM 6061 TaxID=1365250 RepID=A0A167BS13_9GAMM|nr:histidine phosphatase family protein [Pseudoalteromonas luteoviolacea]KZN46840.1 hypothetical protein N475_07470 [Pseudoalteromonas luteoviolacea DSM 6061]KZN50494.1 hypothetical protein N474_03745 [Pseudoalteromonas luteoviolacea CPMOR-2]MBE0385051.1 alpha-ribazole phosphatase [Pseudoalteromonas luteoviolacea DSM 6061]
MLKTIFLIRHTETVKQGHLIGATDVSLPAQSLERLLTQIAKCASIKKIISSPLQRCRQAAQLYSDHHQIPLSIEPNIQEMNFGDWDGQSYNWLWENTASPSIGDFWHNPWLHIPPNGESMSHFESRVTLWWDNILSTPSDDNIVAVTHGGVIKKLLALALALPQKSSVQLNGFEVGYGCIVRISIYYDDEGVAWPKVVF